jgi:prepilin-type processing-associated H-X9-DG protein
MVITKFYQAAGHKEAPRAVSQFRHHATKFRTDNGGRLSVPIEGRANFAFLDGHSKSLAVGQAMQLAPQDASGNYVEDGNILYNPLTSSGSNPALNAPYVLWNIY